MPIYRPYEVDSGAVSLSGTSAIPLLSIAPTSANDTNIVRVKVMIEAGATPVPPSNSSALFQVALATGTLAGGAAVTPSKLGPSSLAANTVFKGGTTAITGLSISTEYWAHAIGVTAGASWEDALENTGLELYVPASALWAVWVTCAGGSGSGMTARAILMTAE